MSQARRKPSLIRRLLPRLAVLAASTALCLIVGEFAIRLLVDPIDFLRPELVPGDGALRWRVKPGSAGHDEWGFRNHAVPKHADIVAIGDSMTYGNLAPMAESWPGWLHRIDGKSVYNMALGGYGPVDYRYLLREKAFLLSPDEVVVGLYFGNDLFDAFRAAYGRTYWASLRDPLLEAKLGNQSVEARLEGTDPDLAARRGLSVARLRHLIGQHSVLYRAVGVSLANLIRPLMVDSKPSSLADKVVVKAPERGLVTILDPDWLEPGLDLDDWRVEEGLRITLDSLVEMHREAAQRGVGFLVVLIPTKLSVFAPYLDSLGIRSHEETVRKVLAFEDRARQATRDALESGHIAFVDVRDAMAAAAPTTPLYSTSMDGHPTSGGYLVIAKEVDRALRERSGPAPGSGP